MYWGIVSTGHVILVGIVILGLLARLYNITEPFIGLHDWASADIARPAQAWLQYGFFNTGCAPVWNTGMVLDGYKYYLHWPSLTYVFILISYKLFGVSDWAARLVPVFFNTMAIIMVYLLGKQLWNRTVGLWGAFFFAVIPINVYYGRIVVFEPVSIFFVLTVIFLYIGWVSEPGGRRIFLYLLFPAILLGTSVHWQVYLCVALMFIHGVYLIASGQRKLREIRGLLLLPLAPLISLAVFFLQIKMAHGCWDFAYFLNVIMDRSGTSGSDISFTLWQYLVLIFKRSADRFGYMTLFLAVAGFLYTIIKAGDRYKLSLYLLLLGTGISWLLVFKKFSFIHEFTFIELGSFVSLWAGVGVYYIFELLNQENRLKSLKGEEKRHESNRPSMIAGVVFFLILTGVLAQSYFISAKLHKWHAYEPLYRIGVFIQNNTEEDGIVLVAFPDPGPPTIDYYSARYVVYGIKNKEDIDRYAQRIDVRHLYLLHVLEPGENTSMASFARMEMGESSLVLSKLK